MTQSRRRFLVGLAAATLGGAMSSALPWCPLGTASAADRTTDPIVGYDQLVNHGLGFSDAVQGGRVAWGDRINLETYTNLYRATGDIHWLHRVVDHADRFLGIAKEIDGSFALPDVYYAHIQTSNRVFRMAEPDPNSPELLANADFAAGTAMPDGWAITGAGVIRSTDPVDRRTGVAGLRITSDIASPGAASQQIPTVPGATYLVQAWAGIDEGATQGVIDVVDPDGTLRVRVRSHHTGFQRLLFEFVALDTSVTIRLGQEQSGKSGWVARFDSVSVRRQATSTGVVQTDAVDWVRRDTDLAAAHRTNDPSAKLSSQPWVMRLRSDGTKPATVSQLIPNHRPDRLYGIAATVRGIGTLTAVDATTGQALGQLQLDTTAFLERALWFISPPAGHLLRIDFSCPAAAGATLSLYDVHGGEAWPQQVHEALIGGALVKFALDVRPDPLLDAMLRDKATNYLRFVADNFIWKWDTHWRQLSGTDGEDNGTGCYLFPSGFSTEWFPGRTLPWNQMLGFARLLHLLYDATEGMNEYADDRSRYLSRANDMHRLFVQHWHPHPLNVPKQKDAVLWNYWDIVGPWDVGQYWDTTRENGEPVGEDLSHAGYTVQAIAAAHQFGLAHPSTAVYTTAQLRQVTSTVVDMMWNQSLTAPKLATYNRGDEFTSTPFFCELVDLAPLDPTVLAIARAIDATIGAHALTLMSLPLYHPNRVLNARFGIADPDTGTPWRWSTASAGAASRSVQFDRPGTTGRVAVRITSRSQQQETVLEQRIESYEPNTAYEISLRAQVRTGQLARAELVDLTTNTVLGSVVVSSTTTSHESMLTTVLPMSGHDLRVRVSVTGTAVVEEVRAQPANHRSVLANGDFELPAPTNPSLPRYWTREPGTLATRAVRATDQFATGTACARIDVEPGGAAQRLRSRWSGFVPGARYLVSATGRSVTAPGLVTVMNPLDAGSRVTLTFDSAQWTTRHVEFVAPAENTNDVAILLGLTRYDLAAASAWFDNITITPLT